MSTATLSVYQDTNYLWCTITNISGSSGFVRMVYYSDSGGTSSSVHFVKEGEQFLLGKGSTGTELENGYIAFAYDSGNYPSRYGLFYAQGQALNIITSSGIQYFYWPFGSNYYKKISTDRSSPSTFILNDTLAAPSTYQITIEDAGNLQQVEFGDPGLVVSSFPYTATVNGNATWYFTGEQSSYTVTAQNTQNMKQIQVGSTVYSSFPASIPITGNTTLQCSGEDDKTITVNYTNTSVPVITDTQ